MVEADADGILEMVGEEEESRGICCNFSLASKVPMCAMMHGLVGHHLPNRRLLIRAYAFFRADVLHLGSSKLLAKSLSVAVCSRFQLAIRHSPCSTAFFLRAR